MDNNELKTALLRKSAVIYKNSMGQESEYKCVSGIIYRERNGHIDVYAEITDLGGHSVTICDPESLKFKE